MGQAAALGALINLQARNHAVLLVKRLRALPFLALRETGRLWSLARRRCIPNHPLHQPPELSMRLSACDAHLVTRHISTHTHTHTHTPHTAPAAVLAPRQGPCRDERLSFDH